MRHEVACDGLVNVVVLAGTVAADPGQRRMPSGDEAIAANDCASSRPASVPRPSRERPRISRKQRVTSSDAIQAKHRG
jgi:hypothetical protein